MPRIRKAVVVLQERLVTEALEYGDVVALFAFEMLCSKQQRSRDVFDTSLGKSWFWMLNWCLASSSSRCGSRELVACASPLSTTSCRYLDGIR